jgi:hypothetical protein
MGMPKLFFLPYLLLIRVVDLVVTLVATLSAVLLIASGCVINNFLICWGFCLSIFPHSHHLRCFADSFSPTIHALFRNQNSHLTMFNKSRLTQKVSKKIIIQLFNPLHRTFVIKINEIIMVNFMRS